MSLDLSEALEHEEPGSPPAVQKSPSASKKTVIPFLIQVSLRDNHLYDTLSWLSNSSVWMLVEARLRQHMVRPTQLVSQILKGQGRGGRST